MTNRFVDLRLVRLAGLLACLGAFALVAACASNGKPDNQDPSITPQLKRWEVHDARGIKNIPSDARWVAVYDASDQLLTKVCAFAELETLEVFAAGGSSLTDSSMERISTLSQLLHLEVIDAPCVSDQGLRSISRLPKLRRLVLRDGNITRDGLECLSGVASLQELVLEELMNDAAQGIPALAKTLNLTVLEVQSVAGLNDSVVRTVAGTSTLKRLRISSCVGFTGESLEAIATKCTIKHLDLSFNRNLTAGALAHVARFSELESLTLQYCPMISAAGLQHLASAPKLAELDLYGCEGVLDDAVRFLLAIGQLKSLVVTRTGMTERGIQEIRDQLKGGNVYG